MKKVVKICAIWLVVDDDILPFLFFFYYFAAVQSSTATQALCITFRRFSSAPCMHAYHRQCLQISKVKHETKSLKMLVKSGVEQTEKHM